MTVEEEDIILATVGKKPDKEDNDEEMLAMVAHFIMTHYAEKEVIKKKKNYKPKSGQYQLEAGIKRFGKQGEMAVTKELNQFNKNTVFKQQAANDLSEEDTNKALSSLIILKEKRMDASRLDLVQMAIPRGNILQRKKPQHLLRPLSQCSSHQLLT